MPRNPPYVLNTPNWCRQRHVPLHRRILSHHDAASPHRYW